MIHLSLLRGLFAFATLASSAFAATAKNCGCECCKGKEVCCCNLEETDTASSDATAKAERHPLRGVILAIDATDSTLTVKHEAIPGVMRAMTMVFKVEPAALAIAKKGETITAQMSRVGHDWWLHEVKVAPKKS